MYVYGFFLILFTQVNLARMSLTIRTLIQVIYKCYFVLIFFFLITYMFVRFKFVNNLIFLFRNNRLDVEAVEV